MKKIKIFNNKNFGQIRTVDLGNNEIGFVAKDVCEALGYAWKGNTGTLPHVPEEWKGVQSVQTPSGKQGMTYLTEQGLYFFLARSDKPSALPFQKWIAGEVIPSIRKTGSYKLNIPQSYPEALRALAEQYEQRELAVKENERLAIENKEVIRQNNVMKSKAILADRLIKSNKDIDFTVFGKVTGYGRNKLFQLLRKNKILHSKGAHYNMPYQAYIDRGYFRVIEKTTENERIYTQTLITTKGQKFLIKRFTIELFGEIAIFEAALL